MLNEPTCQHSSLAALAGGQTFCASVRRALGCGLASVAIFSSVLVCGREAETSLSETNLIPADTRLWTESMLWDEQLTVESGLGYKDNVLLSAFNPHGSAFCINGLDLMVMRLPMDGWKIVVAVVGDDIRYWHNVGADREDLFVGSLQIERELSHGWQAGLEARGLYEDQVLDITTSQGTPTTALVEGYGLTAQPSVRKELIAGWWLKLEVPVTRWLLAAPLDDFWEFGPVVTAGHDFGRRADVTVSYGATDQIHDEWLAVDAFGVQPLPQHLEIFQQQMELAWHQYWDAHRRWHSGSRLIFADRKDNGSGYFNYYEYQAIEDLSWQTDDWQIKGSAQIAYEDYPIQSTAPNNHSSQTLYRNLWSLSLETERRIFKGLKGFAKCEYQRAISNEAGGAGDYHAATVTGGLRYEF